MSTNLFWKPIVIVKDNILPKALKYALSKKYFDHDGSLVSGPVELDSSHQEYISGLRDAGISGASELIDAINKHGRVEIYTE